MIKQIVSGGQTGVDRAALDAAIKLKILYGGWCPKGRLAESGTIPEKYLLKETISSEYEERTKLNIRDSDGTLIIVCGNLEKITDGTNLTIQEVKDKKKSYLIFDLTQNQNIEIIKKWINENQITVLNIAGPRESQSPGIYQLSLQFLENLFESLLLSEDLTTYIDKS